MFNKVTEEIDGRPEFLFAQLAVKNIDFARISLTCVLEPRLIDYTLYQDDHTYIFFHIQSILSACGNLYNIFYGNSFWMRKHPQYSNRPALLRETFCINKKQFPLIFDKAVRNTNEHFDERFDEVRISRYMNSSCRRPAQVFKTCSTLSSKAFSRNPRKAVWKN